MSPAPDRSPLDTPSFHLVAAPGNPSRRGGRIPLDGVTVAFAPIAGVRRATLADVASVARMCVDANREAWREVPALHQGVELSAPEIALRLLRDLDSGHLIYVAERQGHNIGFAHVTSPACGEGEHVAELRCLYVQPEHRHRGRGRQLLRFVLRDLTQLPNPPAMWAWAAQGSTVAGFFELADGRPVRERWRVGQGMFAVRGIVFAWRSTDSRRDVSKRRVAPAPRVRALRQAG